MNAYFFCQIFIFLLTYCCVLLYNTNITKEDLKMRLSLVKSRNTTQFYIIKSYRDENGKNTSKIVEKLGNEQEVIKKSQRRGSHNMGKKVY